MRVFPIRKMISDRNNLIHSRIIFHIKEPFCPPKPSMPDCEVIPSTFYLDLLRLHQVWVGLYPSERIDWPDPWQDCSLTDVIFLCGSVGFSAHRFLLSSVSPLLHRLFSPELSDLQTRCSSETSLASSAFSEANDDTESLIKSENTTPCHRLVELHNTSWK